MGKGKGVKEEIGRGELRQQREGAVEAKKQIDGEKLEQYRMSKAR